MRKLILLLALLTLFVAACNSTPTNPSPTPPVSEATPASGVYPQRPTATVHSPAEQPEGMFVDEARGVSVSLPNGWNTEASPDDPSVVTYLISPDGAVIGVFISGDSPEDETLETFASTLSSELLGGLLNIEVLSDKAQALDDGADAWMTIATAEREDGSGLKISITTLLYGSRFFTMLVFGDPGDFDAVLADIDEINTSLHAASPALYGIPREQALVLLGGETTNPAEYDPATTHGSGDKMVFSGLVSFDPQLQLVPDLAATWEIKDGVTYTFTLRADARFHNGRPVTAQDVVYSWERAASPATESDTVLTYLGDIVGVREMHEGQADHISGLKAVDDRTLVVTIDAPKPYFLLKLTYPTAFVVDRQNVESGAEWHRTPNGSGPYRMARWDSFKVIIYERNDDYYLDLPAIPYVVVQLYSGTGLRLYESGEIDVTGVSSFDIERVQSPDDPLHDELLSAVSLCTGYVVFDVTQPPFDDPKVRQAFSMAFDRQKYIDVVLQGDDLPAPGLYPPALPGFDPGLEGIPFDPEGARRLLAESKYGGAEGLPPIVYTDGGFGSYLGSDVAAMAQMWQQYLGVTITVENLEPNYYLDQVYAGNHGQMFGMGWCADYPDPENFADVLFRSGSQQNQSGYSNPELDALLDQARLEPDTAKRIALYQQAEQIIVADAPVLFTVHSLSHVLVKPYLLGYVLTSIDVPLERYLRIDPEKR